MSNHSKGLCIAKGVHLNHMLSNKNFLDHIPVKTEYYEIVKYQDLKNYYYILKNTKTYRYIKIDEEDKSIWDSINGKYSIKELLKQYRSLNTSEKITNLIYLLEKNGFLKNSILFEGENFKEKTQKSWIMKIISAILYGASFFFNKKIVEWRADSIFTNLYTKYMRYFFNKNLFYIFLFLGLLGSGYFIFQISSGQFSYSKILFYKGTIFQNIIFLMFIGFFITIFHESAHALACKHFGVAVNRIGITIYFGILFAFVDTTDSWLCTKKQRILISFIGPYINFIFASTCIIFSKFVYIFSIKALLLKLAIVSYIQFIFYLIPFIKLDGYYILMDLVGIPNLKEKSFQFIKSILFLGIKKKRIFSWKEVVVYLIYGLLSLIFSFWIIFRISKVWIHRIASILPGNSGLILLILITSYIFYKLIIEEMVKNKN